VDGKKGKLEGKVDIKREGGKVTIEASGATTYAKRYFKYLTKKYLKKCVRGRGGWRSEARAARLLRRPRATPLCSRPCCRPLPHPQAAAARLPARAGRAEQQGACACAWAARGSFSSSPLRAPFI